MDTFKKNISSCAIAAIIELLVYITFMKDIPHAAFNWLVIVVALLCKAQYVQLLSTIGVPIGYALASLFDTPMYYTIPNNLYVFWAGVYIAFVLVGILLDVKRVFRQRSKEKADGENRYNQ